MDAGSFTEICSGNSLVLERPAYVDREGRIIRVERAPYPHDNWTLYRSRELGRKGERLKRRNGEGHITGVMFDTERNAIEGLHRLATVEGWKPYTTENGDNAKFTKQRIAELKERESWPTYEVSFETGDGRRIVFETEACDETHARWDGMYEASIRGIKAGENSITVVKVADAPEEKPGGIHEYIESIRNPEKRRYALDYYRGKILEPYELSPMDIHGIEMRIDMIRVSEIDY